MGPCPVRDAAQKMLTAYIRVLRVLHKPWILRHPLFLIMLPHLELLRLLHLRCLSLRPFLANWGSHYQTSAIPINIRNSTPPTLQGLGTTIHTLTCHLKLPGSSLGHFLHTLRICCHMTLPRNRLLYHHSKVHILAPKPHLIYHMALLSLEIVTRVWINCPADLGSCPVRGPRLPPWTLTVIGRSSHLPAIRRSLVTFKQPFVEPFTDLSLQQPAT